MSNKIIPKVFAHRGAKTKAPENTMAAFTQALNENADGFETDIQFSADYVPLLWHDDNLKRLGLGELTIADFFEHELHDFDTRPLLAGFQESAPLLFFEPFLENFLNKIPLLLELKGIPQSELIKPSLRQFLEKLNKFSAPQQNYMISSFDFNLLKELHDLSPNHFFVGNIEDAHTVNNLEKLKRKMSFLKGVCFDQKLINAEVIKSAKEYGWLTLVYTCNSQAQIESAYNAGVDIIISDTPRKCKEILQNIAS